MRRYRTELILPPTGASDLKHEDGNTQDIINVLLEADAKAPAFTKKFAPTLKGATLIDTCRNVYDFVKTQIPYQIDEPGYQWIKSPGRLWADKKGDCKSFSLFIGSCLRNLGIPYGYRFTSYRQNDPTPTHVYVYVPLKGGGELILDAVWKGPFNTQKRYEHKKDVLMAKISYLGAAAGDGHVPGTLKLPKDYYSMTDGEVELYLARQRAEIDQMNAARIGSPYTGRYNAQLEVINQAIANINDPDAIIGMAEAIIGKAKKDKKKTAAGKLLQKVGQGLKKGLQTTAKVVTAPARLLAKGALEIYLPQAAPMFLYLFTPANAKLPDLVARKKKKQENLKRFIVQGIGMKEAHFMAIIRNNLTKRFGKSPEAYLQERLNNRVSGLAGNNKAALHSAYLGAPDRLALKRQRALNALARRRQQINVAPSSDRRLKRGFFQPSPAEVGVVDPVTAAGVAKTVINAVTWLVNQIKKVFGKKGPEESFGVDDIPDVERDFANLFEMQHMDPSFQQLPDQQKVKLKDVALNVYEAIKQLPVTQQNIQTIQQRVAAETPFLQERQQEELAYEIATGPEAIDYQEGRDLGFQIKTGGQAFTPAQMERSGGGSTGFCQC